MTLRQVRAHKGWETRRRLGQALAPAAARHHRQVYMTAYRKQLRRDGKCRACCRRRDRADRLECKRCRKKSCARNARRLEQFGRKKAA